MLGLVNRVVPRARLLEEAQALAGVIAKNAPLSVRAGKRMVYAVAGKNLASALDEGDAVWKSVYESEDAQEGPRAFREKRAPVWSGR
jgi:enoyl-CoA hydratase/carnithine racemase